MRDAILEACFPGPLGGESIARTRIRVADKQTDIQPDGKEDAK